MSARFTFALATFFICFVCVSFGLASETARMLIVAPSSGDSTALRLRDELTVLGFDVVIVDAASTSASLSAAARTAGASAAARVETWPPEILLWVADGDNTKDDTLRVSQSLQGKIESEMLALRAVELLRGRLLPVPIATGSVAAPVVSGEPPAASVTPTAPPLAMPAPSASVSNTHEKSNPKPVEAIVRPARLSIFLGPSILVSPGGLSPSGHLALSGRFPLANRLAAEAWLFVPVISGTVGNSAGTIGLRPLFFGVGLDERLTDADKSFIMSIGAGMGPMLLSFEGQSLQTPNVGASGTEWAAFAYGRLGLGLRLRTNVRLRFDSFVGPVFPEPVLRIVGREVAHVGRPAMLFTLGAEIAP